MSQVSIIGGCRPRSSKRLLSCSSWVGSGAHAERLVRNDVSETCFPEDGGICDNVRASVSGVTGEGAAITQSFHTDRITHRPHTMVRLQQSGLLLDSTELHFLPAR